MRDEIRTDADDLVRRLAEMGGRVGFPPTPDLASGVRRRIAADRSTVGGWRWWSWRAGRVAAPLGVAVLLVVVLVAGLLPVGGRVAERLGVRGIGIFFVNEVPTVVPRPVGDRLRLGRRSSLAEAGGAVDFAVRVPTTGPLGGPDEVYLSGAAGEEMVSFVYRVDDDLPETPSPGVGALLTQFRGRIDEPLAYKGILPGGVVEAVEVGEGVGYWIEGEAHLFLYRDAGGEVRYEEYRLAGNVLLWEEGGLTFRLESAMGKGEAIAAGGSMAPVEVSGSGTGGG